MNYDDSCPECGSQIKETRIIGELSISVEKCCISCDWHENFIDD